MGSRAGERRRLAEARRRSPPALIPFRPKPGDARLRLSSRFDRSRETLAFGSHPRFGQQRWCHELLLADDYLEPPGLFADNGRSGGGNDAVAPRALGLIQRLVGGLEEGLVDDRLAAGGGEAERDGDGDAGGVGLATAARSRSATSWPSACETPGSTIRNSSPPRR